MLELLHHEAENITEYALDILEKEGCVYNSGNALSLLSYHGCRIEEKTSRVYIPAQKMKEALRKFSNNNLPHIKLISGYAHLFLDIIDKKRKQGTIEDIKKIIVFASQTKNVEVVSTGIEPENARGDAQKILACDLLLRYTQKAFLVEPCSPQCAQSIIDMASIVSGTSEALQKNPRIYGIVELDTPFCYSSSNLALLDLYAKNKQTICLKSSYGYTSSIHPKGLIALQMAEWFAGIFYLSAMEYSCPLCIQLPFFPFGAKSGYYQCLLDYISYQCKALSALEKFLLPTSVPIIPTLGLGFLSGWMLSLQRSALKAFNASYFSDAGKNEPATFSPLHLLIEDECVSYLNEITSCKESIQGFSPDKMFSSSSPSTARLWSSSIFHYEMKDLWRKKKATWQDYIKEYTINRWNALKIEPVISSSTLGSLDKFLHDSGF